MGVSRKRMAELLTQKTLSPEEIKVANDNIRECDKFVDAYQKIKQMNLKNEAKIQELNSEITRLNRELQELKNKNARLHEVIKNI